ncbi:cold shock domain-containing protein [Crocinitomicaceae bacterium]|jgi:cold shock CspA family protein|nr:cold shock domain-containing protein [Crocinitomicaceae bacterium]MDC1282905.1 cold shock domain-containing protein [Crocinitomicaceae bacterium]MDC1384621.1 cold shock domain-containing protein [Crocinitomicaceae bacterium]|tara:strand:- start:48 stop:500 length:453 start_codon:yes stop_codon:yes gene_type:complete
MARSSETFGKKEQKKKKQMKKKDKMMRKEERRSNSEGGDLDKMMAYVDENGQISDTPPDPTVKKKVIKAENIEIGVPKKEDVVYDPIHHGRVSFFEHSKGYGFIKENDSQESYFVHINNCNDEITEGNNVSYELEKGPKGMVAIKVSLEK